MNKLYVYPRDSRPWSFPLCPTPPQWRFDWESVQRQFSWLQALADVPQDAIFHAEGDVLIHTGMVVAALTEQAEWRALPPEERSLLFAAALLHDVGKPSCTEKEIDGRISSRGHARVSERMTRQMFWDEDVPFAQREYVSQLVRFHGLPLQFLDKPSPERAVFMTSQSVSLKHLALLAEADVRGRICADQQDLLTRVELFRAFCQELECYEQPRQFTNDYSRFVYFHNEQRDPNYAAYDETQFEVVLLAGLPGVGKDTWAREHLNGWPVISLDEIRKELKIAPAENQGSVIQLARARAKELLRKRHRFIWNATNILRMRRQELVNMVVDYGGRVRIIYLDAPFSEISRRNQERQTQVPEKVLRDFMRRMEVPDPTEAHVVEWVCG
jgi:putative nucleotidyltransferase with HDIG domain